MATTTTVHEQSVHPGSAGPVSPRALVLRRWVGAACLPLYFVDVLVATAIDPLDDSASGTPTIAATIGHTGAVTTLAWLELLGVAIGIAGLMTFVGAVRGRGAGVANAVGVLGALHFAGLSVIATGHFVDVGLVRAGVSTAQAGHVVDAFHSVGGAVVVLFMLPPLIYVLLSVGAVRAGLLPKAALLLGILFAVVMTVPAGTAGEYAAAVLGLALTGWVARSLVVSPIPGTRC
jgi:hypothetical protein